MSFVEKTGTGGYARCRSIVWAIFLMVFIINNSVLWKTRLLASAVEGVASIQRIS
jgi:hypothetical protein